MQDFTYIALALVVAVPGYLIARAYLAERRAERVARSQKMREVRAGSRGNGSPEADLGEWVEELGESLGFDPTMLFEDEMPAEVKALMPLAKGFIEGGGLNKLLKKSDEGPGSEFI
jgi:hypothetical protein